MGGLTSMVAASKEHEYEPRFMIHNEYDRYVDADSLDSQQRILARLLLARSASLRTCTITSGCTPLLRQYKVLFGRDPSMKPQHAGVTHSNASTVYAYIAP